MAMAMAMAMLLLMAASAAQAMEARKEKPRLRRLRYYLHLERPGSVVAADSGSSAAIAAYSTEVFDLPMTAGPSPSSPPLGVVRGLSVILSGGSTPAVAGLRLEQLLNTILYDDGGLYAGTIVQHGVYDLSLLYGDPALPLPRPAIHGNAGGDGDGDGGSGDGDGESGDGDGESGDGDGESGDGDGESFDGDAAPHRQRPWPRRVPGGSGLEMAVVGGTGDFRCANGFSRVSLASPPPSTVLRWDVFLYYPCHD